MSDDSADENMGEVADKPRLLVIDDDLVQRIIICTIGEKAGYQPRVARSLDEAFFMLQTERFDCITLDLGLGEHSGTRLLRSIAEAGRTPVIVISGHEERVVSSAVRLATSLGIDARQLPKPLNLSMLQYALQNMRPGLARPQRQEVSGPSIEKGDLASAISRNEIEPWFQPKINLQTNRIVGCEALARWHHPTLGFIPPEIFVSLVETSGMMREFTRSIMEQATSAIKGILESLPELTVAVNVSASLLSDASIADEVDRALDHSGLPASALVLEITESAAMADIAQATDILVGLRVRGVGVSIDDFGTGHASLAALARMPFSELKIDNLFVRNSLIDNDMARIVRACVGLGHELGMKIVAEGIDSVELQRNMRDLGCDLGQGSIFAPALSIDKFRDWTGEWDGNDRATVRQVAHQR